MAQYQQQQVLPVRPGVYAPTRGAFADASGAVSGFVPSADAPGLADVAPPPVLNAPTGSPMTRDIRYYTFPGVPAEAVVGWLIGRAWKGEHRIRGWDIRFGYIASMLVALFPHITFAARGGVNMVRVQADAPTIAMLNGAAFVSTNVLGIGAGANAVVGDEVHAMGLDAAMACVSALIWSWVRAPVANNAAQYTTRRIEAITDIIGGIQIPFVQNEYPTITELIELYRMGEGHHQARAAIIFPALVIAEQETTERANAFVGHIRMLRGYGLGGFVGAMRLIGEQALVVAESTVLAKGGREFYQACYIPWTQLSDFDRRYKKCLEGPDYTPTGHLINKQIIPAGQFYLKELIPARQNMVIRGLNNAIAQELKAGLIRAKATE